MDESYWKDPQLAQEYVKNFILRKPSWQSALESDDITCNCCGETKLRILGKTTQKKLNFVSCIRCDKR